MRSNKKIYREHNFFNVAKLIYPEKKAGAIEINLVPFGLVHYILAKEKKLEEQDIFKSLKTKQANYKKNRKAYYYLISQKTNQASVKVNNKKYELKMDRRDWEKIFSDPKNVSFIKEKIEIYKKLISDNISSKKTKIELIITPEIVKQIKNMNRTSCVDWQFYRPGEKDKEGRRSWISLNQEEKAFLEKSLSH